MGKFFSTTWAKLKETVEKMSKKMRILVIAAIVVIIASSVLIAVALNKVNYVPLYTGLSAGEAGQIATMLEEQGVEYKVENTDTILVAEERVNDLRISFAAQGYPQTGLSYDIFSDGSTFGSTDVETQVRLQYQLQENLRTTINSMNKIEDSIVIVNLPTKSSYVSSSNRTEASAAVMLSITPGQTLSNAEARAIAEFIMKSIPTLKMDNVSIVDAGMNIYDVSDEAAKLPSTAYSANQQELAENMKAVLADQVLRVLEPSLGSGNVAVSVNLHLDFDETTVSSVEFAPPVADMREGLLRSSEVLHDALYAVDELEGGRVGTDSNGLSGTEYVYDEDGDGRVTSDSLSEIYNYELNEVQTQIKKAQGTVTGLSVAVVINSEVKNADKVLEQVGNLVANAIGVDSEYISVAALPFVESANMTFAGYLQQNENLMKDLAKNDLIKTLCICGAVLLGVIILVLLLRKIIAPKPVEEEGLDLELSPEEAEAAELAALADAEGYDAMDHATLLAGLQKQSEISRKIDELMSVGPETAVLIIRNWLSENN